MKTKITPYLGLLFIGLGLFSLETNAQVLDNVSTLSMPMFEYNKNYTVIGELTVDDTYNCINCTFNMSENSSIVVEGGSAFNLGNSSIQSLDGT